MNHSLKDILRFCLSVAERPIGLILLFLHSFDGVCCRQAFFLSFFLLTLPSVLSGQGTNLDFGQNRVQHKDFSWSYYTSPNFVVYSYLGEQQLGSFTTFCAEEELSSIEEVLDYRIDSRIEILVYTDVSDLNQSNIGASLNEEESGGVAKIHGAKVYVYFNGNHQDLRIQIRNGIARVLLNNMMFGGNVTDILQSSVLLNLPEWFTEGLYAYVASGWTFEDDNRLKDLRISKTYKDFNRLAEAEPILAGKAFWFYLDEEQDKDAIPNLLYLVRINRSIESGFLYVFSVPMEQVFGDMEDFYDNHFDAEQLDIGITPSGKRKIKQQNFSWKQPWRNEGDFSNVRFHPDGEKFAFASYELGQWKVFIGNARSQKTEKVLKGGFKTELFAHNRNYPLVAWEYDTSRLVVIYEHKDVVKVMSYDYRRDVEETRDLTGVETVTGVDFTDRRGELIISAIRSGQSDLYLYNVDNGVLDQITNDFWDDSSPRFADFGDRLGYVFVSNRPSSYIKDERFTKIMPTANNDIFFLNELSDDPSIVTNITNTPDVSEEQPLQIDADHFAFLSDSSGIQNRYVGYLDSIYAYHQYIVYYPDSIRRYRSKKSLNALGVNTALADSINTTKVFKDTAIVFPETSYVTSIETHDIAYGNRKSYSIDVLRNNGKTALYINPVSSVLGEMNAPAAPTITSFWKLLNDQDTASSLKDSLNEGASIVFQSEFGAIGDIAVEKKRTDEEEMDPTDLRVYRIKYANDKLVARADNQLIIDRYQNFVGNGPLYQNPPVNGMLSLSITDIFEDYRFTGGYRIPSLSRKNSEYFFSYEDMKSKIDKKYLYYRKTNAENFSFFIDNTGVEVPVEGAKKLNYYEVTYKFPIDILRSLRVQGVFRDYKIEYLSKESFSLELPNHSENWLAARGEFVYDNTYLLQRNIRLGTRYNVYGELQKAFNIEIDPGIVFEPNKGFLGVVGFDYRNYLRIKRNMIWANRLAAGNSFGNKRLLYYLGGVDGWLFAQFDQNTIIEDQDKYAFQTVATNMRGFKQNVRNGSSFAVFNTEVRFPVFSFFSTRTIKSEMLKHFQLIAFGDMGGAWNGISPFSEDNAFLDETIGQPPVTVDVKYFRQPIVTSFGVGARTVLFGYFVRGDIGWGIDSGIFRKPLVSLSLQEDF